MKKLLFITPTLCQGGIEHSQITMLKMLDGNDYDLSLFVYINDMTLLPQVPKNVRVVTDNIKVHYFRKPKALLLNAAAKITGLLKLTTAGESLKYKLKTFIHKSKALHPAKDIFANEQFDVVISNAIGICTEMALHIKAKRYVVWYRASVDMHHEMLEKLFPKYDYIVAVSNGVKAMLSENYPLITDKIKLIPDFVSYNQVQHMASEQSDIACSADLKLCSCGRFTVEKGFDLAVDAAKILKDTGIKFVWYFVGDGSDRHKLEQQIRENSLQNYIVITGFLENPFPVIRQCDIYIQPSYEEAFGRTIKEALILGKKVVSTNTAGAREILGVGNIYGLITDISAKGLADGICAVNGCNFKPYTSDDNEREAQAYHNALEACFTV